MSRIKRLYLINFLTGLVFWYGIEKLFMTDIGITAAGVGIATSVFLIFNLIFDIPSGILADRWSRKGMLIISSIGLGLSSLILGNSHGLFVYMIGNLFYGVYIVANSGTYQAIVYDVLHEENRSDKYSKIIGRSQALFLIGVGIGNASSGFIANYYGFRAAYFISIIVCLINIFIIYGLKEPTFHKLEMKEKTIKQISDIRVIINKVKILRMLALIMALAAVVELFKSEFSQLYMMRYVSLPQVIGILYAVYAFTEALGSLIAHRFKSHLNLLIVLATFPLLIMAFVDTWVGIAIFMFQSIAWGSMINNIESLVQDSTPSHVRASMLLVMSTLGRVISVPSSFLIGWIIFRYDALWAVRFIAIIAFIIMSYWLIISKSSLLKQVSSFEKLEA